MATDKIQEAAKEIVRDWIQNKGYAVSFHGIIIIPFGKDLNANDMLDLFEAGAIWQEQQGWVRVEENSLPAEGVDVLILLSDGNMAVSYWDGTYSCRGGKGSKNSPKNFNFPDGQDEVPGNYWPTHWRPLPYPPGSTPVESKEGVYREAFLELHEILNGLVNRKEIMSDMTEIKNKLASTEALKP